MMNSKVAVVTGGASGIGRLYATHMADSGFSVAVVDRSAEALSALCKDAPGLHPYPCDVTDRSAMQAIMADIKQTLGPIDRLVHCAAIFPTGELHEQDEDSIAQLMLVNYGGTVTAVRSVLNDMRERNSGQIVIFGSLGGVVPIPECGAYCASKAAVNFFAEILIEENRDNNVHIMLVCPPLVDTPLLQQAADTGNPSMVQYSMANKRFASPQEIIDASERGLRAGKTVVYPKLESKIMLGLRRLSPRLVWSILRKARNL